MTSPGTSRGSAGAASAAQEVTGRAETVGEDVNARPRSLLGRPPTASRRNVDEIAVARRIAGDHTVWLSLGEREEAVRQLHGLGLCDRPIGRRLGISERTVLRIRGRLGLGPNHLKQPWPEHGRLARYRRGCHCDLCRAANARQTASYNRRPA